MTLATVAQYLGVRDPHRLERDGVHMLTFIAKPRHENLEPLPMRFWAPWAFRVRDFRHVEPEAVGLVKIELTSIGNEQVKAPDWGIVQPGQAFTVHASALYTTYCSIILDVRGVPGWAEIQDEYETIRRREIRRESGQRDS